MKYNINSEPIVVSKPTLDLFLDKQNKNHKIDNGDLIALYTFYYYTAKWQQTTQPRCNVNYISEGLNWSEDRVRKTRKILLDLGLIEDKQETDTNGKFIRRYVKVNLAWSLEEIINLRTRIYRSTVNRTRKTLKEEAIENALKESTKESLRPSINRKIRTTLPIRPVCQVLTFIEMFPENYQKDKEFLSIWENFVAHRKEIKAELTKRAALLIVNEIKQFVPNDIPTAIKRIAYPIKCKKLAPNFEPWDNKTSTPSKQEPEHKKAGWINGPPQDLPRGSNYIPDEDYRKDMRS